MHVIGHAERASKTSTLKTSMTLAQWYNLVVSLLSSSASLAPPLFFHSLLQFRRTDDCKFNCMLPNSFGLL